MVNEGDDGDEADDEHESARLTYLDLQRPRASKPLRELPRLVRTSLALVWVAGRREAIGLGVLTAFQALGSVVQLLLVGRLISKLNGLKTGGPWRFLVPELVAMTVALTVLPIVGLLITELRFLLGDLVTRRAQSLVARAAANASLLEFESPEFHDRLQRALVNASSRPIQVATALATISSTVVTSIALVVALAIVQPIVLVAVLLGGGPVWVVTRRATRIGFEFSVNEGEVDRRRAYLLHLLTAKPSAKEIRAYQLADHLDKRYGALWDARIARVRALVRRRSILGTVGRLANGLVVGAIIAVLVWTVASGRADVGKAVIAAGAVVMLGQRLSSLTSAAGLLYECGLFLSDLDDFLNDFQESVEPATATARPRETLSNLEAQDLTFRYPTGRADAVHNVSMHVRQGEMIALVGPNGSGKTTLAKLLAGLLPPSNGTVAWNGEVMEAGDASWTHGVAVMFQDFTQFMLTLRENITFGRVERSDDHDATRVAIDMAGLEALTASLPIGMETLLGPEFIGGTDISGGQWQRVALGRAFFRDAPVLILDEPSAALDPEAEAALFGTVKTLCRGRAVIVVSHRFSTVMQADRIYVLDKGSVLESGSHAELMALDGTYARMFRLQASRYLPEVEGLSAASDGAT